MASKTVRALIVALTIMAALLIFQQTRMNNLKKTVAKYGQKELQKMMSPAIEELERDQELVTMQKFLWLKSYILAYGNRQTYCNMYNNNPHIGLTKMHVYLNPDTGQRNINCNLALSDFNYIVFRTEEHPPEHYEVGLSFKAKHAVLVFSNRPDREGLRKCFEDALAELRGQK